MVTKERKQKGGRGSRAPSNWDKFQIQCAKQAEQEGKKIMEKMSPYYNYYKENKDPDDDASGEAWEKAIEMCVQGEGVPTKKETKSKSATVVEIPTKKIEVKLPPRSAPVPEVNASRLEEMLRKEFDKRMKMQEQERERKERFEQEEKKRKQQQKEQQERERRERELQEERRRKLRELQDSRRLKAIDEKLKMLAEGDDQKALEMIENVAEKVLLEAQKTNDDVIKQTAEEVERIRDDVRNVNDLIQSKLENVDEKVSDKVKEQVSGIGEQLTEQLQDVKNKFVKEIENLKAKLDQRPPRQVEASALPEKDKPEQPEQPEEDIDARAAKAISDLDKTCEQMFPIKTGEELQKTCNVFKDENECNLESGGNCLYHKPSLLGSLVWGEKAQCKPKPEVLMQLPGQMERYIECKTGKTGKTDKANKIGKAEVPRIEAPAQPPQPQDPRFQQLIDAKKSLDNLGNDLMKVQGVDDNETKEDNDILDAPVERPVLPPALIEPPKDVLPAPEPSSPEVTETETGNDDNDGGTDTGDDAVFQLEQVPQPQQPQALPLQLQMGEPMDQSNNLLMGEPQQPQQDNLQLNIEPQPTTQEQPLMMEQEEQPLMITEAAANESGASDDNYLQGLDSIGDSEGLPEQPQLKQFPQQDFLQAQGPGQGPGQGQGPGPAQLMLQYQ